MRTLPMYKRYEDAVPVGIYPLSADFGLIVFKPDELDLQKSNCDYVCCWSNSSGENTHFHRHCVRYTDSGRPYIEKGHQKFYMDRIVRVSVLK